MKSKNDLWSSAWTGEWWVTPDQKSCVSLCDQEFGRQDSTTFCVACASNELTWLYEDDSNYNYCEPCTAIDSGCIQSYNKYVNDTSPQITVSFFEECIDFFKSVPVT